MHDWREYDPEAATHAERMDKIIIAFIPLMAAAILIGTPLWLLFF